MQCVECQKQVTTDVDDDDYAFEFAEGKYICRPCLFYILNERLANA